jgi:ribosomal protein L17
MSISIENLPFDTDGGLTGLWMFQLRQNLHGNHAGAFFQDGRTVTPVDSLSFKRFVASMGADIVGAIRVASGDPTEIGDVTTLKPLSYDDAHSKTLAAQDSNKLLAERQIQQTVEQSNASSEVTQHLLAGAKFQTPEEQANRQAFEDADPKAQEKAQRGGEPVVTPESLEAGKTAEETGDDDEEDDGESDDDELDDNDQELDPQIDPQRDPSGGYTRP